MRKVKALFQSIRATSSPTQTQQTLNLRTSKMEQSKKRYTYNPSLRWNPQVEEYFIKAYGSEHFSRISSALTRPSCYSCIRVNTLKTTSDAIVEKLLSILRETGNQSDIDGLNTISNSATIVGDMCHRHRSFFNELNCHEVSDHCVKEGLELSTDENVPKKGLQSFPVTKCQIPGLDHVVFVQGSGPHTLKYGNASNTPLKELIVSRKCAEAVLRGAKVFVPGVLACSAHVEKGDTVAVSVAIEQPGLDNGWSVGITRGTVLQGLQTDPQYFERDGMYIGQGTAMMSRAGIFRASEGVAVEMTNRVFDLPSFHDVLEGEIFLQNLPSIVTAHVLDPKKGERILDMCAAPGGKTTAIAILVKDEGEVVAVDRSHNKVLDIKKLVAKMGLNCITAYKLDALKAVCRRNGQTDVFGGQSEDVSLVSNVEINEMQGLSTTEIRKNTRKMKNGPGRSHTMGGRVETSKGFPPNSFDRVLLDAPCSALGLRPRLFAGEVTVQSLRNHGKYQRKMFDQAIQLVRPGGIIVYSTCTINPGENEALVRYALDTYKFLTLASQSPRIGGPGLVGRCEYFDGEYVEEWLRPGEEELVQRFDPSSPLDTIGFFIAKFNVGQKDT